MRVRRQPADVGEPTWTEPDDEEPGVADANEIVAYNFRRARELRGWTQELTADRLSPLLGQRLRQASISAIEGAYGGERRREFDAQEILAFAVCFDVPLVWFFLPPPDDRRELAAVDEQVRHLYVLTVGREDQLDLLRDRFRELGHVQPNEDDAVAERLYGRPTPRSLMDYQRRRKELLLALLDSHTDQLDAAAEEMGRFFDHLRQVGVRGFIAENANDPDYMRPPELRGLPTTEDYEREYRAARDQAARDEADRAEATPRPTAPAKKVTAKTVTAKKPPRRRR
jgi:transcriptional regulator with XRE-family HTH domain